MHIEIEAEAGSGLLGLVQAHNAVQENEEDEVLQGLRSLAAAQESMRETLLRMPERCDPYVYYSRVRPYIHGWKDSPALPEGFYTRKSQPTRNSHSSFAERPARKVLLFRPLTPGSESAIPMTL